MTNYFHFLLLSLKEKKQYLEEHATLLLTHPEDNTRVNLYAVCDFFVEMHIDERKKVLKISAFKGMKQLSQHAEYVDLSELNVY